MNIQDPKLHSHIEDTLPDDHPLAFESVECLTCHVLVHAFNNECMQTWIETGQGNFCVACFANIPGVLALHDEYGLSNNK